jgi:hypothetical protein
MGDGLGHLADLVLAPGMRHVIGIVTRRKLAHVVLHVGQGDYGAPTEEDEATQEQCHRSDAGDQGQIGKQSIFRTRAGLCLFEEGRRRGHQFVHGLIMYMECPVQLVEHLSRRFPVAGQNNGQELVVHGRPIGVALDQDIILELRIERWFEIGLLPEGSTLFIKPVERLNFCGILFHYLLMRDHLVCEHVGFNHVKRRRKNVGDQVLAVDDLLVDRSIDLQILEDIFLERHRADEAQRNDCPEDDKTLSNVELHVRSLRISDEGWLVLMCRRRFRVMQSHARSAADYRPRSM